MYRIRILRYTVLLVLLASLSFLSGCAEYTEPVQLSHVADSTKILQMAQPLGQTFSAHHAYLNGIDIWLEPGASDGVIQLHLRAEPQATDDVATVSLPLAQVTAPDFYHFSFAPRSDSYNHYYYVFLELAEDREIPIGVGDTDTYLDGALYQNHQPIVGQMTFRLTYTWWGLGIGLARTVLESVGQLLITCLLYGVPGWALLLLFSRYSGPVVEHWTEGVGVAAGLSLALYPCLFLWTHVIGLRLGVLHAWLPVMLGVGVLLWHYRPWRWDKSKIKSAIWSWRHIPSFRPDLVFIAVVAIVGLQRFLMVRGLTFPLWDDSNQHTMIVRRILESGGLFQSWQPYVPYQTFSQQFGFHALASVWAWFTRSEAPQAVLWSGQALNVLAVLTLYPLAYRIRGVWAGIVTVILAGVFLQFPSFYVNWGRYPQMCGQVLLSAAVWWVWRVRTQRGRLLFMIVGGGLTVATAILSYYRMIFHYATFVIASVFIFSKSMRSLLNRRYVVCLAGIAVLGTALMFPWFLQIMSQARVSTIYNAPLSQTEAFSLAQVLENSYITWSFKQALWIFTGALLGVWVGGFALVPAVWGWLLMVLPILRQLPLPGVNIIQSFTISTSLYIPQALTWGTFFGLWIEKLSTKKWLGILASFVLVGTTLYQLPTSMRWLDRGYTLVTQPDLRAAQWIKNNTASDALFLIRGTIYSSGTGAKGEETAWWMAVMGSHAIGLDGGGWLPVLTRRAVTIPPLYLLQSEEPEQPGYTEFVNDFTRRLLEIPVTSPEGITLLCQFPRPITHLYLGQYQGVRAKIATDIAFPPLFDAEQLLQSSAFRLVYQQDHVMIFEFDRTLCQ
jgi:hypothetical protein